MILIRVSTVVLPSLTACWTCKPTKTHSPSISPSTTVPIAKMTPQPRLMSGTGLLVLLSLTSLALQRPRNHAATAMHGTSTMTKARIVTTGSSFTQRNLTFSTSSVSCLRDPVRVMKGVSLTLRMSIYLTKARVVTSFLSRLTNLTIQRLSKRSRINLSEGGKISHALQCTANQ